jgi:Holliday junction resolvasome RuvABC endonuclease subunit
MIAISGLFPAKTSGDLGIGQLLCELMTKVELTIKRHKPRTSAIE